LSEWVLVVSECLVLLLFVYHVPRFVQSIRFFPSLCASLYSYLSLGIHIMDRGWLADPGELANCGPGASWHVVERERSMFLLSRHRSQEPGQSYIMSCCLLYQS